MNEWPKFLFKNENENEFVKYTYKINYTKKNLYKKDIEVDYAIF